MNTKQAKTFSRAILVLAVGAGLALGIFDVLADVNTVATFPLNFESEGRIEIAARLMGDGGAEGIPGGGKPILFISQDWSGGRPGGAYLLAFSYNDGAGGSGIVGRAPGNGSSALDRKG